MTKIHEINLLGQSIWLDSISRNMFESGQLSDLIKKGVSGLTSNPTIFDKAVSETDLYDNQIKQLHLEGKNSAEIFEAIAIRDVQSAADLMINVYKKTQHKDGYISIEVSPKLANNSELTIEEGIRLWNSIDRPNIMIKVPGTESGSVAIRKLISLGINVNVTLLFSVESYIRSARAYIDGLNDYINSGGKNLGNIASVASFFVSRLDTAVDKLLNDNSLKGKSGIFNAYKAYELFLDLFGNEFDYLRNKGGQVQRPLWASTSVKNPSYSPTLYVEKLMGPNTVNTLPENTLEALLQSAKVKDELTNNTDVDRYFNNLEKDGLSVNQITYELLADGIRSFLESYDSVIDRITNKIIKSST